uniref:DUF6589 domain-containing protein n=1 Tax=Schizophyllum commune (strain H4-8 / FGSC 9210) TaxID=578458 RepID=D8Q729_SCHCM
MPRGGAYLEGADPLSPPRYFGAPIPSIRASEPEPPAAETPPPVDDWVPRDRKPKRSIDDVVGDVLRLLSNENISFATLVLTVLTNTRADYEPRRSQFYAKKEGNVGQLLDALELDSRGKAAIAVWFRVRALDLVCQDVYKEMEKGKSKLHMQIKDVTSDFLETWDLKRAVESAPAPTLMKVLEAASENRVARAVNTNRSPLYVQRIVFLMLHHARSQASSMLQNYLGVYFWSEGCPRRLIEFLSRISLAPSYTSTLKIVESLSAGSTERARAAVRRVPHAFAYDNFNVSMSEHVEQRPDAPSKVQSGTFGLIYEIHTARWSDVRLQPMMQNLKTSTDLTMQEISPSVSQLKCYMHQCQVHVVRALTDFVAAFSSYATAPVLQHIARHPLPAKPTAVSHSLGIHTIAESSIEGNMVYQEEVGQRRRPGDITAWTRREIFQLGPGLFHLLMNLIWAVLNTHRATVSSTGSLTWFFNVLDKRRLGREKPDFHTLLVSLQQILNAILLHAWRLECGDLDEFAQSQPSPDRLLEIAAAILRKYATPRFAIDESLCAVPWDPVNRNLRLLMRDLFYVVELARAIADGDIGRVEDIFPGLARIFRGAGYNNYSTEILYFLHNVRKVWTPRFA